jgi:hypothetical protein
MPLFDKLGMMALEFFAAVEIPDIPEEPPLLGPSLGLLQKMLCYAPFLDVASENNFPALLVQKSSGFYATPTLEVFFLVVEVFLCNVTFQKVFTFDFFGVIAQLANRAISAGEVSPLRLFKVMNTQYWRHMYRSGLVRGLLDSSEKLSFRIAKPVCTWLVRLVAEADVRARREIASIEWFDLVLRNLHSDRPKVIDQIAWTLVFMRDSDPEFWTGVFEQIGLLERVDAVLEDLNDPTSLKMVERMREQLFPESWESSTMDIILRE